MEERKYICYICGEELDENNAVEFRGEYYCEGCLEDITVHCNHCGTLILRDGAISDSHYTLCHDCYNEYYTCCEDCGRIISNDDCYYIGDYDDYPYCYNCYQEYQRYKGIHDYSYKPDPIFHGNGSRFFGVELEVDYGGHLDDNAREVLEIANETQEENLYIKHDGSLEDGFELVSHPMTLDYHKNIMPWKEIMKKLVQMDTQATKQRHAVFTATSTAPPSVQPMQIRKILSAKYSILLSTTGHRCSGFQDALKDRCRDGRQGTV